LAPGGAAYLWYLSKDLALACGGVTFVLWCVALRYGGFSRKAQRTYQDALANTNEVCEATCKLALRGGTYCPHSAIASAHILHKRAGLTP